MSTECFVAAWGLIFSTFLIKGAITTSPGRLEGDPVEFSCNLTYDPSKNFRWIINRGTSSLGILVRPAGSPPEDAYRPNSPFQNRTDISLSGADGTNLTIESVRRTDEAIGEDYYECQQRMGDKDTGRHQLIVQYPPDPPTNLTLTTTSAGLKAICVAGKSKTGSQMICLEYQQHEASKWNKEEPCQPAIRDGRTVQFEVSGLQSMQSYNVCCIASNAYGATATCQSTEEGNACRNLKLPWPFGKRGGGHESRQGSIELDAAGDGASGVPSQKKRHPLSVVINCCSRTKNFHSIPNDGQNSSGSTTPRNSRDERSNSKRSAENLLLTASDGALRLNSLHPPTEKQTGGRVTLPIKGGANVAPDPMWDEVFQLIEDGLPNLQSRQHLSSAMGITLGLSDKDINRIAENYAADEENMLFHILRFWRTDNPFATPLTLAEALSRCHCTGVATKVNDCWMKHNKTEEISNELMTD